MKKAVLRFALMASLLSVPMMSLSQSTAPPASLLNYGPVGNWGCEVMLCLADPKGPMNQPQCRDPITRLYKAIFKWRPQPFPVCILSNGSDSKSAGNYAQVGPPSYYDACPVGTTELGAGEYAIGPVVSTVGGQLSRSDVVTVTGIGSGAGLSPNADSGPLPQKVCVGEVVGQTYVSVGSGDNFDQFPANVVSNIVLMDPAPNTFTVQLYIKNQLYKTVRPGVVQ
jgi:hypothetical protein